MEKKTTVKQDLMQYWEITKTFIMDREEYHYNYATHKQPITKKAYQICIATNCTMKERRIPKNQHQRFADELLLELVTRGEV